MPNSLFYLVLLAAGSGLSWSQAAGTSRIDPVTLEKPRPTTIAQGTKGEISLSLKVAPKFHIQANPASEPNLIATVLYVGGTSGVAVGSPIYPPGKPYRLAGADKDVMTLDGTVGLRIPVSVSRDASIGTRLLDGKVRYQACDDKICLMPQDVEFKAPIKITRASK